MNNTRIKFTPEVPERAVRMTQEARKAACPLDLVKRQFKADRPNQL
jgi:hypothetical protein